MTQKPGTTRKHALSPRTERFLDDQRLFCKASTIRAYRTALVCFDRFLIQRWQVPTISPQLLRKLSQAYLDDWLAHLHARGLKPWSKINYFLPVRKYLVWEIDRKTLPRKTIERFTRSRLPKPPDVLPKPLSIENDAMLVRRLRASPHPYAPLFLLLRFTGMRISELINLSIDSLHLTVQNEAFLKIPIGKMNNERMVPLHQDALQIVQTLLASNGVTRNKEDHDPSRLCGLKGDVTHLYAILNRPFRKITADISDQGKPVTFHRLRHTYATSLLSAGVSIVTLMKLLGHRRIEMTLRYASISPTLIRNEYLKATEILEQRFLPHEHLADSDALNHPSSLDLLALLRSSIAKDTALPSRLRYNFLKRLSSLSSDIARSAIPPPPHPGSPHTSTDFLAS